MLSHFSDHIGENLESKDDIVDVMIGFGRWQLLSTFLVSVAVFIHMLNAGTDSIMRPDGWWCRKPDFLQNWTTVEWIMYSHSSDSCVGLCNRRTWDQQLLADGYFRGCEVYNINYEKLSNVPFSKRPAIQSLHTTPCPYGVEYSNHTGQNLAEKFEAGCYNGTIGSNFWKHTSSFGKIVGYLTMGTLSDRIGRKMIFFISCGLTPLSAIVVATSKNYIVFIISNSLYGFVDGGIVVGFILIMEIATNSTRSKLLAAVCCSFAFGIGLTATINNLFLSYDIMVLCTNSVFLLMFGFITFLPESPPWLFCNHKISELESSIIHGRKMNKMPQTHKIKIIYIENGDDRYKLPKCKPDLWNIISEPEIAYEIIGITYFMVICGLIFGSSTYEILASTTKSHLANSLLTISVVIGVLCGQICLLLMEHRKILQISIVSVLISSIMLTIDLHDFKPISTGPTITLLLINVATVSLSYSVLLNYNSRTMPTQLRGTLFGTWKSIWALFVWIGHHDYVKFPTTAFSVIMTCVVGALFSLNFKDLYDRELPDTIFDSICFEWKIKHKRWAIDENELSVSSSIKKSNGIDWRITRKLKKKNFIKPPADENENK